jgi:hypothetical protein
LGQLAWAALTYPPPIPVWNETAKVEITSTHPVDETLAEAMYLTDFSWREPAGQTALEVTLWWEALQEMPADYLIELSLRDQNDVVSYSVSHPVQGRYPTRAWEAGDVVKDVHFLPLPGPLAGDHTLQLRVLNRDAEPVAGTQPVLLDTVTLNIPAKPVDPCTVWFQGQRDGNGLFSPAFRLRTPFTVIAADPPVLVSALDQTEQAPLVSVGQFHAFIVGPDWDDLYELKVGPTACGWLNFDVPPRYFQPPQIAHPLDVNFNNEVKLLGYELPTRRIEPGGRLPLTLVWQGLATMGDDYQIFDNLLDEQQQRWGGYDRRARDGYSTLLWVPGEVITDAFGVPVDPAAPDGVYTLDIGLYRQTETGAESLPVMGEGQPTEQTGIRLGPIKVGGPPPDIVTDNPAPQVVLNQFLGGQIALLGYDLKLQDDHLNLTLYWQPTASPDVDYTTFVHLRDASNRTVAQKDAPPGNGRYPTSLWDSGETIVDPITLPVAEVSSGDYTLVVGLYDFATGQRLPVAGNPANEINLEIIELP